MLRKIIKDYSGKKMRNSNAYVQEETAIFIMGLRPEVLNVKDELMQRIPKSVEVPNEYLNLSALDNGMLAGVNPIGETADYIDFLTRSLS